MKSGTKFIAHADLAAWLNELAALHRVVAPRAEGASVVYRDLDPEKPLELFRKPTESAKHVLFPRSEELFSFAYKKPAFGIGKAGAKNDEQPTEPPKLEVTPPADPVPTIIFGMPGCDAGGVTTFDPIYNGRRFPDVYYLKKRDATILIARACNDVLSTCFCTWVGGSPANRKDADILATQLPEGWLLEPLTERAGAVMGSALLKDGAESQAEAAEELHAAAEKAIGRVPDLKGSDDALLALFDDADFWWEQSAGCIACGGCTYLCPTCHCFAITDETAGMAGVRLRSWDTCMAALYTLEASGHNPRTQKAARLRNRVGHKFSYFIRNNEGTISCCGCGRCIKSCPSSVDIRRIVLDALAKASKGKEAANG